MLDKCKVVESTYENEYVGYMDKKQFKLKKLNLLKLRYNEAMDSFIS